MERLSSHILVVDDNETNRDILSRRLERRGHEVTLADGGVQALACFEGIEAGEKVPFEVVLLDVMMPDINGLDVLKELRQRFRTHQLPIIMVTALAEQSDVISALELDANDYITKPIEFPVLFARLNAQIRLTRTFRNLGSGEVVETGSGAEMESAPLEMIRDGLNRLEEREDLGREDEFVALRDAFRQFVQSR